MNGNCYYCKIKVKNNIILTGLNQNYVVLSAWKGEKLWIYTLFVRR